MYPAFQGQISGGKLVIPELAQRERILEGKHLAVTVCEVNEQNQVVGGVVEAGIYEQGSLNTLREKDALRKFDGRQAFVVVRQELVERISPDVFDVKFQLGAKLGDLDT